jgi:MSHA biogenesis protein MshL
MKLLMKFFCIYSVSLLLISCTVIPPKGRVTTEDLSQTLHTSVEKNALIKKNIEEPMSEDITNALLPDISVQFPKYEATTTQHFDVNVEDVPLQGLFNELLKNKQENIVIDPRINELINLHLKNVTLPEVLDALRDLYGNDYQKASYGYIIYPSTMKTQLFSLNYINVDRQGTSETSMHSGEISSTNTTSHKNTAATNNQTDTSSVITKINNHFWAELTVTLNSIIGMEKDGHHSETASVTVNPQTGMIAVHAYPNTLREIAEYLNNVQNIMNREVMIDAKILEVQLDADYQSGVDWKALGIEQHGNQNLTDQIKNFSSIFTLSGSWGSQFEALIKLMSDQGKVNVISSPRISTVNNQKAVIKVGTDQFFVTGIQSTTDSSSGGLSTSQNIDFTPFFSGIILDVTPEIDDHNNITLHIHPMISEVTEKKLSFTTSSQKQSDIPLASSSVRESDNIVRAKSGQVIVIGGLMKNSAQTNHAETPLLNRIPIIGGFFKSTHEAGQKTELIILLQPNVISDDQWNSQLMSSEERFSTLNNEFRFKTKIGST